MPLVGVFLHARPNSTGRAVDPLRKRSCFVRFAEPLEGAPGCLALPKLPGAARLVQQLQGVASKGDRDH